MPQLPGSGGSDVEKYIAYILQRGDFDLPNLVIEI